MKILFLKNEETGKKLATFKFWLQSKNIRSISKQQKKRDKT